MQAARAELERIVHELQFAEATWQVYGDLEWVLNEVQKQELTEASGPLIRQMETFLKGAGRDERPYFEAGRGYCDIGWEIGAERIAIQALSGGEYALFCAALTSAVIVLRGAPLRLLLIEAAECDEGTMGQLLAGIDAVVDSLTAAVVCTWKRPESTASDWAVVDMERERSRAAA